MIKTIKYFIQSVLIYIFYLIGKLIGLKLSRKFFSYIFIKFASKFKSEEVIQKNLNFFSNKMSQIERKKITLAMWDNYGKTFVEYIFLSYFKKNNSHVKISGEENLKDLMDGKKQAIFVSGHFANFELMSMEITKKNIKLATIYRPLNNFFINPLMEYLRRKYVCPNQIKKGINGVRNAIGYLKKNHSIALMIDQRVSEGELVDFFGKPALTTTLPAQLAFKYNLPLIPVYIERKLDNDFVIEFQRKIDFSKFESKLDLTKRLNEVLEEMIKRNPHQWIWTHNRWK